MNRKNKLIEVHDRSLIVGGYIPSNEMIYRNEVGSTVDQRYTKFLPLLEELNTSGDMGVRFVNPDNRDETITQYNANSKDCFLDDNTVSKTKIDLTMNDLRVGSDLLVLNFTNSIITTSTAGESYKTFGKIVNERLDVFEGKVVIFEVTSVNREDVMRMVTNIENFYDSVVERLMGLIQIRRINKQIDIYNKAKEMYENVITKYGQFYDNTIKVVNILVLGGNDINKLVSGTDLFIDEYGLVISTKGPLEMAINPLSRHEPYISPELYENLMKNGIRCYINDPTNRLSDRYIHVIDRVIKIPKLRDFSSPAGMFIKIDSDMESYVGLNETESDSILIELDKVDELDYVYKTIEEAEGGADRIHKLENESKTKLAQLNIDKINLERELMNKRLELEQLRADLNREKEEIELEYRAYEDKIRREKDASEMERLKYKDSSDTKKSELELLKEQFKLENEMRDKQLESIMDREKFSREVFKSNTSTVSDTLKVVGAILAFAAGGYVLYKKLN